MKISTARLKRIIKEELFYREFHRTTDELTEDKVGDKISKLKDEGKPQKQAVAIALDMEARGDLEETDKSLGATLQGLKTKRALRKHVQSIPPEDRTIAGTQNLDHLHSDGDPEQNFFRDKGPVDPDDVGTQTMEFTPDQMKRLRELTNLKEGFAVSKQDLVSAGLPLGSVRSGLYDRVIVRLERVGARRGLPALKLAVRSLRSYELNDPSTVLSALEREL